MIFLFFASFLFGAAIAQDPVCLKMDFNREAVDSFDECYKLFLPKLSVKKYADHPELQPYRPTSRYFYSPTREGAACVESKANFKLDANSIIQAAVYFDYKDAGAWVSINVVNLDTNKDAHIWKYEQPAKWFMIEERVTAKVERAMVRNCVFCQLF